MTNHSANDSTRNYVVISITICITCVDDECSREGKRFSGWLDLIDWSYWSIQHGRHHHKAAQLAKRRRLLKECRVNCLLICVSWFFQCTCIVCRLQHINKLNSCNYVHYCLLRSTLEAVFIFCKLEFQIFFNLVFLVFFCLLFLFYLLFRLIQFHIIVFTTFQFEQEALLFAQECTVMFI